jgi:hypothetical protein
MTQSPPLPPPAFQIKASADVLRLDVNRTGQVSFTVRNVSGRLLHCGVAAVPAEGAQRDWFGLAGPPVEELADQAERTVQVNVTVPAAAQVKPYAFRLDAVGVENPDEYSARGPQVAVELTALPAPATGKGYLETLLGSVAGGVVGLVLGTLPGSLALISAMSRTFTSHPGESFGQALGSALGDAIATAIGVILLFLLGVVVGIWVGPVVGAWLALRIRAMPHRALTVGLLAVILPVWAVVVVILLALLTAKASGAVGAILLILALAVILALPPLAARRLALLREGARQ